MREKAIETGERLSQITHIDNLMPQQHRQSTILQMPLKGKVPKTTRTHIVDKYESIEELWLFLSEQTGIYRKDMPNYLLKEIEKLTEACLEIFGYISSSYVLEILKTMREEIPNVQETTQ